MVIDKGSHIQVITVSVPYSQEHQIYYIFIDGAD